MKEAMKLEMVDDEGENRAVRMFLALYGGACGVTAEQMRKHLKMAGFDGAWPEWASNHNGHLTKAGAQLWIRHLFNLEQSAQQEPVISTEHGPWIPSTHPGEEGESYCKRCLLRDKFLGSRQCNPHIVEQPAQPQAQQQPVPPSAYESLTRDMTTIAARQVPIGVPITEFAMHALADAELREHDAAPQPAQQEPVTVLPDGSAFAVMSYPLPKDHWLYADRQYNDGEYEPVELGKPVLTHELRDAVVSAMRYAIRGATNCGKEADFDPDALVQNAVYALCGPFTSPPAQRPWVGLTAADLDEIDAPIRERESATIAEIYQAIEAKLKEKNA